MFLDRLATSWQGFQRHARESLRVLVVDDEPTVCLLVSEMLSSSGYQVVAAASLAEARAMLEEGGFHLLVADKNLPDGSGIDLLKERRSKGDSLPAVIITGYPSAETVMDALTAGASDYISKPFDDVSLAQERLESVIEAHMAQGLNERMVQDLASALDSGGPDREQISRIAERLFRYKKQLGSRPAVLVVEDNLAVAEVVRKCLEAARLDVQVATDLRAAEAWVQRGDGPLTALVSV
ncbi:MAG: response regulator, partial [Myxococcota bacterium]